MTTIIFRAADNAIVHFGPGQAIDVYNNIEVIVGILGHDDYYLLAVMDSNDEANALRVAIWNVLTFTRSSTGLCLIDVSELMPERKA